MKSTFEGKTPCWLNLDQQQVECPNLLNAK